MEVNYRDKKKIKIFYIYLKIVSFVIFFQLMDCLIQ